MSRDLEKVNPIKDESDARSIVNLVPTSMSTRIKAIPETFFDLGEDELEKLAKITEPERKLRIAFWLEYERAQRTGTVMAMTNVFKGLMHARAFTNGFITNSYKLAYLVTPLEDYRLALEDSLRLAIHREKEVLKIPVVRKRITTNRHGDVTEVEIVDSNLALVQHKIRESIQNRLQGMPVHRSMQITETRSVNSNSSIMDGGAFDMGAEALGKMSEHELRDLIKKLQGETPGATESDSASSGEREVIDVTTTDGPHGLKDESTSYAEENTTD
jgi:hypothetical protein